MTDWPTDDALHAVVLDAMVPNLRQADDAQREAALAFLRDPQGMLDRSEQPTVRELVARDGNRVIVMRVGDAVVEIHAFITNTGRPVIRVLSEFAQGLRPSGDFFERLNAINTLFPETTIGAYPSAPGSELVKVRCMAATVGALISPESIVRCVALVHGLANMILKSGFVRDHGGSPDVLSWAEVLGLPVPDLAFPDAY